MAEGTRSNGDADSFAFVERLLSDWSAGARARELLAALDVLAAELRRRRYVVRLTTEPPEVPSRHADDRTDNA